MARKIPARPIFSDRPRRSFHLYSQKRSPAPVKFCNRSVGRRLRKRKISDVFFERFLTMCIDTRGNLSVIDQVRRPFHRTEDSRPPDFFDPAPAEVRSCAVSTVVQHWSNFETQVPHSACPPWPSS